MRWETAVLLEKLSHNGIWSRSATLEGWCYGLRKGAHLGIIREIER